MKTTILKLQEMKVERHSVISPLFSTHSIAACFGNPIASSMSAFLC